MWPVAIIGTGFAGLGMAIKLREAGLGPFIILERAAQVGGTWRDNHYPGCACDVPAPLYSFSFAPNPNWSRLYASHAEILSYLLEVVQRYQLRPHIRFDHGIVTSRYDARQRVWRLSTADGRVIRARVVVSGMGALSNPSFPDIPGTDSFRGSRFHSAQWDHSVQLTGKRVAVIGTGASAIQFVPEIAKAAQRLFLFQRTPPWIIPRPDRAIGPTERALYRRVPAAQTALRGYIYGKHEVRALAFTGAPALMRVAQRNAERHLRRQIVDPQLRRRLTPSFTIGCKRVLVSNDYYPAVAGDNVQLVTDPIDTITTDGVATRKQNFDVDAIVYGTGFSVQQPFAPGAFVGRDGVELTQAWTERMTAYKGTCVSGFPNLFLLAGPNTGLGHSSMVYMIESQIAYVLSALRAMKDHGWETVDVTTTAQDRFNTWLDQRLGKTVWSSGCRSWYLDDRGRNTTLWPTYTFRFRQQTATFDPANFRIEG